jgi:hypothetical protein
MRGEMVDSKSQMFLASTLGLHINRTVRRRHKQYSACAEELSVNKALRATRKEEIPHLEKPSASSLEEVKLVLRMASDCSPHRQLSATMSNTLTHP